LIAMVCRLTIGREAYEEVEPAMRARLEEADAARETFLGLADRDAAAFDDVMTAFRMPRDDDRRRAERSAAIQRAYDGAARVPLEVASRAADLMGAAAEVTRDGNANAASDGVSAALVLHAAVHAALANVAINVSGLKDGTVADELRDRADELARRAEDLLSAAREAFAARIA
jgi:formiminotetrahydrofolate cyclodeaminase